MSEYSLFVVKSTETAVLISAKNSSEAQEHFKKRFQEDPCICFGIGPVEQVKTMLILKATGDNAFYGQNGGIPHI